MATCEYEKGRVWMESERMFLILPAAKIRIPLGHRIEALCKEKCPSSTINFCDFCEIAILQRNGAYIGPDPLPTGTKGSRDKFIYFSIFSLGFKLFYK